MIIRQVDADTLLADRRWLAGMYGLKPETIRKRWTPVACDIRTRTALYKWDHDQALAMKEKARPPRQRVAC